MSSHILLVALTLRFTNSFLAAEKRTAAQKDVEKRMMSGVNARAFKRGHAEGRSCDVDDPADQSDRKDGAKKKADDRRRHRRGLAGLS